MTRWIRFAALIVTLSFALGACWLPTGAPPPEVDPIQIAFFPTTVPGVSVGGADATDTYVLRYAGRERSVQITCTGDGVTIDVRVNPVDDGQPVGPDGLVRVIHDVPCGGGAPVVSLQPVVYNTVHVVFSAGADTVGYTPRFVDLDA